jgi:hypothetical protein
MEDESIGAFASALRPSALAEAQRVGGRPRRSVRLILALLLTIGLFALGGCAIWPSSGDGPDVRVNGVSGTVLESMGPNGGGINDFIAPNTYAYAPSDTIDFDYPGSPTWVTVVLHGAGGIWDVGGPPGTFSIPAGTWDWLTAKVYWSKHEYAIYGWRLTDAAPGMLLTEPSN